MIEVEAKYRSPGNEKVEKALTRLGAKRLVEETLEDIYFSHPNRDFGETDEALRLRKRNDAAELSYKGPRMSLERAKAREEINLTIDNALNAQRIVERLGFKEFCIIKKTRRSYQLDRMRVDVDDVEELGEFVELEALTESPDKTTELFEFLRKELSLETLESKTYLELILEKKS